MGQYYTPVILDEEGNVTHAMNSHDFNNGLKLMEHSWLDNDFVAAFETLLVQESPRRVVWAGDYADPEVDGDGNPRRSEEGYDINLSALADEVENYRPDVKGFGKATYTKTKPPNAFPTIIVRTENFPYVLNWDKKEFVDKRKVPQVTYYFSEEPLGIHPLPLLTAEGNGRGGGDFDTEGYSDRSLPMGNFDLIGRWARDHISEQATEPGRDWTEIDFDLVEMGHDSTPKDRKANVKMRNLMG